MVNQHLIFSWKLLSLGISITCGYAAVAHFVDYPQYGVTYMACFLNAASSYTLVYDRAFQTPTLLGKLKVTLLLHLNEERNRFQRKVMQHRVLSIPSLGINVGRFRMMERTSTPVFLHYVLSNIVSMLVAHA